MSQLHFNHNTITFEPGQLEHSSNIFNTLNIRPVDPFWFHYYNQVNQAYQLDPSFYHQFLLFSTYYNGTMDTETIVIGSNTRNGRVIKPESSKPYNAQKKGTAKIDVYANGVFLRQMPFKVLVRFSKATAAAFPKKADEDKDAKKANAAKTTDNTKDRKSITDWAEDDGEMPDVVKEMKKLQPANTNAAPKSATRLGKSSINFSLETMYIQPSKEAFDFSFQWMHIAKEAGHGDAVLNFGVQNPDNVGLEKMVDLYAVALILDIRPAPHKHRFELLTKMTEAKPTLAGLKYVHERLPVEDFVVTRFITSYFDHRDRPDCAYTDEELKAIEDYVCTIDMALHTRFKEIGASRSQRSKYLRKRREEARLEKATEDYLSANGNVQSDGVEFIGTGSNGQEGAGQKNGGFGGKGRRGGKKQ